VPCFSGGITFDSEGEHANKLAKNLLCLNDVEAVGTGGTPPCAMKALLGVGFTKGMCQNLVYKELRYQNLDNKRLRLA
jgi:hypothetical protein